MDALFTLGVLFMFLCAVYYVLKSDRLERELEEMDGVNNSLRYSNDERLKMIQRLVVKK